LIRPAANALLPRFPHRFADPALAETALTHRSAGRAHNERLEFLGDAVVGMLVAEALYAKFPSRTEGELTRLRAELVREGSLAAMAREIDLGEHLRLGPGELKSGGWRRDSILADAFEALMGAVWLDAGLEATRAALAPFLAHRIEALGDGRIPKDPKTSLQEWLQGRALRLPEYELIEAAGNDPLRAFAARCRVHEPAAEAIGFGTSRRAAEIDAAASVLVALASADGVESAA
jgi:ribonuclease-3